ncbi:hypothetical protein Tco_0732050 [Tanacetum coccineum]
MLIDHFSKDCGSYTPKRFDYVDPQGRLKHMTGKKSFLTDYQEIDGGFVAFGGSPKGVKRIFRYLKGQPKLGLWYPRDLPFDLEAFSDSDYAGASLDRKSTIGGCQFLGKRLISWQCKKQTIVANSTTEAEYVATANCYRQGRMIAMDWRCFLDEIKVNTGISKISTARIGKAVWLDLTATVRTVDNGEQEINATIDGKEFTITEASVRRHLQLADADGISALPNTKIFDQLTLMGYVLTDDKLTFQKDEVVHQERGNTVERAATTATSLEAVQDSRGNTPRSDEDSMTLQELMALCTKLSNMVLALETDLRQTKKVYGTSYTKIIMKVKKLEKTIKTSQARRRVKIVVSDDDMASEDSSKQGRMIEEINQDVGVTLVTPTKVSSQEDKPKDQLGVLSAAKVLADVARVHTFSRRRRAVSTDSGGVTKDKGKAFMTDSKAEQTTTKLKQRQERVGYEAAIRLQEQLSEEESQRIARDAEGFTEDEWEDIRARVEANEELTQKLQVEERDKYSEVDQARMLVDLIDQRKRYFAAQKAEAKRNKPMTQAQQRTYMSNYIKHMGSHTLQQLNKLSFDEVKELFETTMKRVNSFTLMESDDTVLKVVAGSSKRYVEQDIRKRTLGRVEGLFELDDNDILWKLQRYMHDQRGHDIFMLVEKDYPLTRALMTLMLSNKLQVDEYSVMADELLRKIFILANRPRQGGLLGIKASQVNTAD